jgi:hypothetical protein
MIDEFDFSSLPSKPLGDRLEILLSEEEPSTLGIRVLVRHLMEGLRKYRRAAEELSDASTMIKVG